MPTVIDSLVVLLGLDASKFNEGQKKALENLKKTKDEAAVAGKDMEASGKQAAQFFGGVRNEAIRLFAVLVGFKGLSTFTTDTIRSVSATGRLARNIGETTKAVGLWENAVKLLGGDGEAAGQSMMSLSQSLQEFALTGQSNVIPYFRALGVGLVDLKTGKIKETTQLYLELAGAIKKNNVSPQQANFMLHQLGLDQGTINLIIQGRSEIEKLLALVEKQGVANDKDAASLQRLQTALTGLGNSATSVGRDLLAAVANPLAGFLEFINKPISESIPQSSLDNAFSWHNALGIDFVNRYFGPKGSDEIKLPPGSGASSVFDLFQKLERSGQSSVSPKGAIGRNQIMPGTAKQYGFDPGRLNEPEYNDMVARAIQTDLFKRYNGDLDAMAIAYNAGPGRANQFLRNGRNVLALPKETQDYVARERALVGGSNSSVHIDTININTKATDAKGIAADIRSELGANSLVTQGNQGPQ